MALSAPTRPVWVISVVVAALAVLGRVVAIPFITDHPLWLISAAFLVLLVGTSYKGV